VEERDATGLLAGSVQTLRATGYRYCFGLGEEESLSRLAAGPLLSALKEAETPRALVFQHCNAESAVLPRAPGDSIGATRNQYFAAHLMETVNIDHLPYLCSFASGCAGFLSLLITAAAVTSTPDGQPTICVMADSRPPGTPFDLLQERILGSDHSSAFLLGPAKRGYQLLGISYYSTVRKRVPLVEVVKRSVEMVTELVQDLHLDPAACDVAIHYPNIFPTTWKMVTRYLEFGRTEHIMEEMAERAHCGATDSVISLAKWHRGQEGRLHVVVNYGVGLHLGVCILREHGSNGASSSGAPA
jgi:3-oxoacyl-[acyl-carrier-protein] synthase III